MADLVQEYYFVLRGVLRAQPRPRLRPCLTRCRHCHIFFLTHPRNAGRRDLRCPFGCRETHRKRESTKRSVAYYRGEDGKECRRRRDGNRQFTGMAAASPPLSVSPQPPAPGPPAEPASPPSPAPSSPPPGSIEAVKPGPWPTPLLVYLRMVISLIEGRPVSGEEIREMLGRVLRQHSIGRRRPLDHIIEQLHEYPP